MFKPCESCENKLLCQNRYEIELVEEHLNKISKEYEELLNKIKCHRKAAKEYVEIKEESEDPKSPVNGYSDYLDIKEDPSVI